MVLEWILTPNPPGFLYLPAARLQTTGAALCNGVSKTPAGGLLQKFPLGAC